MICGERVRLRPHEREDLPRYVKWLADPLLRDNLALAVPFGLEEETRWFDSLRSLPDIERPFAIEAKDDQGSWRLVGSVGMQGFDWRSRSAEIGLFVGEEDFRGRGIGTEAMILALGHAFETLNLHRVHLRVYEDNARARRVYEKIGFTLEGRLRDADFRHGQWRAVMLYAIFQPDWLARVKPPGRDSR